MLQIRREGILPANAGFGAEIRFLDEAAPTHGHDFLEFAVVLAGSGSHVTRDGSRRVRRGDAVVVRAFDWHGWDDPSGLTVANVYVDQLALRGELATASRDPTLRELAWPRARAAAPTTGSGHLDDVALLEVEHAIAGLQAARSTAAVGHLLVVLGTLTSVLPRYADGTPHPAAVAALALLQDDPAAPWTARSVARSVGVHERHLSRLFRRAFGATPMDVLTGLRGELAAAQLISTDLAVAEIGRRAGWPDPNYFARRFRALHGVSPRQYRARFR